MTFTILYTYKNNINKKVFILYIHTTSILFQVQFDDFYKYILTKHMT